jgi:hypothetical protein
MAFRLWATKAAISAALDGSLRPSRHVLATARGDELVLLDLEGERYYTLNEVGSRVWTLLDGGATRAGIVDTLRREYDIRAENSGDALDGDVARLLAELYAAGLVIADRPSTPRHQ